MRGQRSMSQFLPHLVFSIVVGLVAGSAGQSFCSSSCGSQLIEFPFRLNGDPAACGLPDFELDCDNTDKTTMELHNGTYYVTNIFYDGSTIGLVDANVASGRCSLPSRFPFGGTVKRYSLLLPSWASFVNCSNEIRDGKYQRVPCLSGNDRFVYATLDYRVTALAPSCSFLSMVPMASSPATDILESLKDGFYLTWEVEGYTSSQMISHCLSEDSGPILEWFLSPILSGNNFLGCLQSFRQSRQTSRIPFALALFCVVIWDIVAIALGISLLVRFIFAPLAVVVFLAYECWKMMAPIDSVERFLQNQQSLEPKRYAYTDIIVMTGHFREKLGQGGFGSVYKGELLGGQLVAVKMLDGAKCLGEDFINEVSTIGRIHHLNVVRLVGFCSEGARRALVYEFMPNGSLDKYIFSSDGAGPYFTVERLNEIALGVARGVDYLHQGCDMRILHFDIKPHNILLDRNFNPKVSDFGLAKLYPKDFSLVNVSVARGTIGYIAPELVSRSFGVISHKADVYSFGMLLLEMAGGRRNVDHKAANSSQVYYPSWIYDRLLQSEAPEICASIEIDDMERKLCKVGLWCIQVRPAHRPSMSSVVEMLEGDVDKLQLPPKPFHSAAVPVSVPVTESHVGSSLADLSIISEDDRSSFASSSTGGPTGHW